MSSEEAASDALASERYCRDEGPAGPPAHAPPLHCSEPAENGAEKNLPLPRSGCGSRRRSAVWKHFYLSPLDSSKAVCVHCMNEFSRGKNGKDLGTSCLIRHMWRAHRAIVLRESGGGEETGTIEDEMVGWHHRLDPNGFGWRRGGALPPGDATGPSPVGGAVEVGRGLIPATAQG